MEILHVLYFELSNQWRSFFFRLVFLLITIIARYTCKNKNIIYSLAGVQIAKYLNEIYTAKLYYTVPINIVSHLFCGYLSSKYKNIIYQILKYMYALRYFTLFLIL